MATNQRSLEAILKDIDQNTETLSTPLENISPRLLPGFQMSVREAKEQEGKLRTEYATRIGTSTSVYFPFGNPDKAVAFKDIAAKEGDAISVDSNALYLRLAEGVEPSIGHTREFGSSQIMHLTTKIREEFTALGFPNATFNRLILPEVRVVADVAAVAVYARELCERSLGTGLNAMVINKNIIDAALASRFAGKVLRIVVLNATPEEYNALNMSFRRITPVNVDLVDTVDSTFVINTFKGNKTAAKPPAGATSPAAQPNDNQTNQ